MRKFGSEKDPVFTMTEEFDLETVPGRCAQLALNAGVPDRNVRSYLAEVCGISVQAIHRWFDGRTKHPKAHCLADIAKHFNADLMWIVTGESDPRSFEKAHSAPDFETLVKQKIQECIGAGPIKSVAMSLGAFEITTTFHEEDEKENL